MAIVRHRQIVVAHGPVGRRIAAIAHPHAGGPGLWDAFQLAPDHLLAAIRGSGRPENPVRHLQPPAVQRGDVEFVSGVHASEFPGVQDRRAASGSQQDEAFRSRLPSAWPFPAIGEGWGRSAVRAIQGIRRGGGGEPPRCFPRMGRGRVPVPWHRRSASRDAARRATPPPRCQAFPCQLPSSCPA